MRIEGSTKRDKGVTITIRTEGVITGTIMRSSRETITEGRRSSQSTKRRKTVVIIDEKCERIFF
jgi:hypothetical protein